MPSQEDSSRAETKKHTLVGTEEDPDYEELVYHESAHFFDRYQEFTRTTAIYPGNGTGSPEALTYCILGLGGESGELQEKFKKLIRGGGFNALVQLARAADSTDQRALAKEAGDVIWYVARLLDELGMKFSEVMRTNVDKLSSRKTRGVLHGSGDDR